MHRDAPGDYHCKSRHGTRRGSGWRGAVLIHQDHQLVAEAHNETIGGRDLTQHAELIAIRRAMQVLDVDRLPNATLCVTLEPCGQCAGAIVLARVGRVIFGAFDPKAGMAGSVEDLL